MQEQLADLLQQEKERLTIVWSEAVRRDPRIKSAAGLSNEELLDHVPGILEEISEILRVGVVPDVTYGRDARVHVYTRLRQGYRARDLVSELSLLRMILLDYLTVALAEIEAARWQDYTVIARVVNLYLDEEMRYAVSVYTEAKGEKYPGAISVV